MCLGLLDAAFRNASDADSEGIRSAMCEHVYGSMQRRDHGKLRVEEGAWLDMVGTTKESACVSHRYLASKLFYFMLDDDPPYSYNARHSVMWVLTSITGGAVTVTVVRTYCRIHLPLTTVFLTLRRLDGAIYVTEPEIYSRSAHACAHKLGRLVLSS